MKLRANNSGNARPSVCQTRGLFWSFFARSMTLAAWVLYFQDSRKSFLKARAPDGMCSSGSSPSRAVQPMKSRAKKNLNVRLGLLQVCVHVRSLFARAMKLAARVLYRGGQNNQFLPAPGTRIDSTRASRSEFKGVAARKLDMRVPPAVRAYVVPPPPALFNI